MPPRRCGVNVASMISGMASWLVLEDGTAYAGRGFGTGILHAGECWLRAHYPAVSAVVAEILPQNQASLAAFTRVGFRRVPTSDTESMQYERRLH